MLSASELARLIAQEGMRLGMGQAWFDQNFGSGSQFGSTYGDSTWVQGPTGAPVISPEYLNTLIPASGVSVPEGSAAPSGPVPATPPAGFYCPIPSFPAVVAGSWVCVMPDGALIVSPDDDEEGFPPATVVGPVTGGGRPSALQPSGALPAFVGGQLGLVITGDNVSPGMDAVSMHIPELAYVTPFGGGNHHRRRGGRRWR